MAHWIIPLGVTAITFLIITFLLGLRSTSKILNINPRLKLKLHKIFAWLTIITAVIHGTLVYILYL